MRSVARVTSRVLALTLALSATGALAKGASPWGAVKTPAEGPPRAIGDYSAGCLSGAEALPMTGEGYQVMHPSRLRYFGHPLLVDVIEGMGQAVAQDEQGVMLIGDMSQPRGGRASGGHASHQSGLDVDIWFWHPKKAEQHELSTAEREQIKARSVLNGKRGIIRPAWKARVRTMLKAAAEDARVERMFVHPIIKRDLCQSEAGDRGWLRKVRPWYGHDDHVHVRLFCPEGSPECESQAPIPKGDGCDKLDWWFDAQAQADRKKARSRYRKKVVTGSPWPEACNALLPPQTE